MTSREPDVVIREAAPHLAFLATESMYADQPDLWDLGEKGRHHTLNDFTLHFQAVATGEDAFRSHVDYCYDLEPGVSSTMARRRLDLYEDNWLSTSRATGARRVSGPSRQCGRRY